MKSVAKSLAERASAIDVVFSRINLPEGDPKKTIVGQADPAIMLPQEAEEGATAYMV